jgi:hypothetical protein
MLLLMTFIPLGDQNPLRDADGQARALNVILEQLCLVRAEVGAVQGTLLLAGDKLGLAPSELVRERVKLRDDLYQRIHEQIRTAIAGPPSSKSPSPG